MPAPALSPSAVPPNVAEMAKSDLLFELGVVGAMRHFRARHFEVRQALALAPLVRSPEELSKLHVRIEAQRLRARLVGYERKYPRILRAIREGSHRRIGAQYGVSHRWVGRIDANFRRLAEMTGVAEDRCLRTVEAEARG